MLADLLDGEEDAGRGAQAAHVLEALDVREREVGALAEAVDVALVAAGELVGMAGQEVEPLLVVDLGRRLSFGVAPPQPAQHEEGQKEALPAPTHP